MNLNFIDTIMLDELGNDMLNEINVYKQNIDYLFERINNMSSKTCEWIGIGADSFVENFNLNYVIFIDVYDCLKNFSLSLIDYSNFVDNTIKKYNGDK